MKQFFVFVIHRPFRATSKNRVTQFIESRPCVVENIFVQADNIYIKKKNCKLRFYLEFTLSLFIDQGRKKKLKIKKRLGKSIEYPIVFTFLR